MTHESEIGLSPEYEMRKRDIPCWYEISWEKETKSLQLKIHPDFIQNPKYDLSKDRPNRGS